jgi:PRD1 phage membrane DNA delivery
MLDRITEGVVTVALAIVGLAVMAVLVSRNAQTPQVLQAGGAAFSRSLLAAEAPVMGGYSGFTESPGYYSYY